MNSPKYDENAKNKVFFIFFSSVSLQFSFLFLKKSNPFVSVERTSFAAHTRFNRRHYNEANASSVFTQSTDFVEDTKSNLTIGQYPEKRHFPGMSNVSQQQRSFDEVEKKQ